MAARVANRTRTDEVVEALIELSSTNPVVFLDELTSSLGRWASSPYRLASTLLYLEHCYGTHVLSQFSGEFLTVDPAGIERYVDGPAWRTPCGCGRCGGEGEYER